MQNFTLNTQGRTVMSFKSNINIDNGFTNKSLGEHLSTMEMFLHEDGKHGLIEWDIPSIEETEHIGVWFDDDNVLTDYDGVFDLPLQAIILLEHLGYTVPEEFRQM